jgi:hypothetical protein
MLLSLNNLAYIHLLNKITDKNENPYQKLKM